MGGRTTGEEGCRVNPQQGRTVTAAEVAERLRGEKRVLAITHEAPDGDALGLRFGLPADGDSGWAVEARGYIPGELGLPSRISVPARLDNDCEKSAARIGRPDTTMYMLDCASLAAFDAHRMPEGAVRVNIDHHQDNPGLR